MDTPKISDIQQYQELLQQAQQFDAMKQALPMLSPALKLIGVDTDAIRDSLDNADEIRQQIEEMMAIPDTFNDIFSQRGWILYDRMNLDTVKAAIKKAQDGDLDGAEVVLADYYDAEATEWQLRAMHSVNAFYSRVELAEKALEDYKEGRYHACIPVVLALLDGMVNEVNAKRGERRGFFAQDIDLTAWNSVAAHSKGLGTLTKIFQTSRTTTITDPISIPYRNGILHGMDLGYDNKLVAAKTWGALFATRDWAMKAERNELEAPPQEPKPTWGDVGRQLVESAKDRRRLDDWKPRELSIGVDLPQTGSPEEFAEDTPERKLAEFINYWKSGNYGRMTLCVTRMLKEPPSKLVNRVRELYTGRTVENFQLEKLEDDAAAITTIHVRLWGSEDGETVEQLVEARMIYENEQGMAEVRGKANGEWRLVYYGLNDLVADTTE